MADWKVIDVPGIGPTEFPSDMPDKDIIKAIQRTVISQKIASDPISQGAQNFAQDMPWHQKFLAGMGKAPADLWMGTKQALGIENQQNVTDQQRLDAPLMKTGAGFAGNVAGNIAAMAPAMMIPDANTMVGAGLMGGAYSGLMPTAEGESRGQNALIGMLGGAGGQAAANIVGRAVRPVQSSLNGPLSALAEKAEGQYGIPLKAAQRTGSKPLAVIDSVLENLPLTADKQAIIKEGQKAAFNRAVLKTVGEASDSATPDVLNAARTRIGGSFNEIAGRNNVSLGDPFVDSLAVIESQINAFSSPAIRTSVDKALDLAAQGSITGKAYQQVRSTLGKQANDAFKSGNSELGQALKQVKGALDDAATSSISKADQEAWRVAREQWQALKVVEKAAAPVSADAVAGNVSAAKLAQALQQVDKKGFTYGTRADELSDLARIGQAFIKDQVPNSGTAQRSFYQNFLTHPVDTVWQGGIGGLSVPIQRFINSRAGQA